MLEVAYIKIGQLAKQTGLSVGTIRYYSDIGVLSPAKIGENGYRYYTTQASYQIEFIKKAQTLGFSLEEIKQIIQISDRGEPPCNLVKNLINDKIQQLETQIEQMIGFKAELEKYQHIWNNNSNPQFQSEEICPLISSVPLSVHQD